MSTKVYDVWLTDKDIFTVFGELINLREQLKQTQTPIIHLYGDVHDVDARIEAVVIPKSPSQTIVRMFYGDFQWERTDTEQIRLIKQYIEENYKDYHYQNSTDKPDQVSEEEWDLRNGFWSRICDERGGSFSDMGLTMMIYEPREITVKGSNKL